MQRLIQITELKMIFSGANVWMGGGGADVTREIARRSGGEEGGEGPGSRGARRAEQCKRGAKGGGN